MSEASGRRDVKIAAGVLECPLNSRGALSQGTRSPRPAVMEINCFLENLIQVLESVGKKNAKLEGSGSLRYRHQMKGEDLVSNSA